MEFIRVRCLRSYPLPLYLNLRANIALNSIADIPTLLDRCATIHIHSPEQWRAVEGRLPHLNRLVLSCRLPNGNWKEIPTLRSLKVERAGGIGDLWTVPLLENIVQLEATYSWKFRNYMQKAPTFAPRVQVLRLNMVELSRARKFTEDYYSRHIPPYAVQERTFNQLTHLVLRYTNISPIKHPLPFVGVPCLVHLEILLRDLRNINGLLAFDYPTVTKLTVTMFGNLFPAVTGLTEEPADIQSLLDLMKRLPNLSTADLTVTSVIMASLCADLGRNPTLYPPLSIIWHCLL